MVADEGEDDGECDGHDDVAYECEGCYPLAVSTKHAGHHCGRGCHGGEHAHHDTFGDYFASTKGIDSEVDTDAYDYLVENDAPIEEGGAEVFDVNGDEGEQEDAEDKQGDEPCDADAKAVE